MHRIFLDDLRIAPKHYTQLFRSAEDMLDWLRKNKDEVIDLISFDHDLGPTSGPNKVLDGYELIQIMIDEQLTKNIQTVQFHTDNNQGFQNMAYALHSAVKHEIIPPLVINTTKIDCIDGVETPAPWYRLQLPE